MSRAEGATPCREGSGSQPGVHRYLCTARDECRLIVQMRTYHRGKPLTALIVVLLAVGGCTSVPEPPVPAPEKTSAAQVSRPNIVLITTDDQTLEEMRSLPLTRRLIGKHGVTFTNMLSPHPNCCPARAQILTGQYAQNNGVRTNSPPHGGHEGLTSETALPVWLDAAGYKTGFVGKYLHGYDMDDPIEPGWDIFHPIIGPPLSNYTGLIQYIDGDAVALPAGDYHTRVVAQQSAQMIKEFSSAPDPFFVWTSYISPHGTCVGSEELDCSGPPPAEQQFEKVPSKRLPSLDSPSFNEEDMSDKPPQLDRARTSIRAQKRLYAARVRSLASVDDAVRKTVGALRSAGELEKTLILFTSDNGYLFGEHRQSGKVLAYEESVRVPLLMRGPGIPADGLRDQTVAMIDLAPTFVEVTNASPLVDMDGVSLWGYATKDVGQEDRAVLVQAGSSAPNPEKAWQFRGVRTDRYTFVRWLRPRALELYDRSLDPWQLNNVADDPAYADRVNRLRHLLDRLAACSGLNCRVVAKNLR